MKFSDYRPDESRPAKMFSRLVSDNGDAQIGRQLVAVGVERPLRINDGSK
jgi:hypothetical protein